MPRSNTKTVKVKIGAIMIDGDTKRSMKIIGKMDKFYLYVYFGDSIVFARTRNEIERMFELMKFVPLSVKKLNK